MNKNIPNRLHLLVLCLTIALLVAACSSLQAESAYQYQKPADLGDGWETASLRDAGLNSRMLAAMMEDIHDGGFDNLHSLLIVKDGRLVFEEYFHGHNQRSIDYIASVTKSVTSILVGIAIDRGFIIGPGQNLTELLPTYNNVLNADPLKNRLQLWHLLTMTSGFEWDEETFPFGDPRNDATAMERSPEPVLFVLSRPIIREPGSQFQYSGANSMLLSAILEEATGMTAANFAQLYLFEPLGISQYRWDTYTNGLTHTDGGLSLRPRDMAKIGQLMLNGGQWDGVQIVSKDWAAESTKARTTVRFSVKYGYQWWRENQAILLETVEPYFAAGFGGQLINVYPDQNMIVVVTSDAANHNENSSRIMFLRGKYILPATVPAVFSTTLLWGWYILTVVGLVYLVLEIGRGHLRGFGSSITWLLIGAIMGPLGMGAYFLSYRNKPILKVRAGKALGISSIFSASNITGLILLTVFQTLFLPTSNVILLVVPVLFLVSWLAFIAPLTSSAIGIHYWKAARHSILTAFVGSCFTLAGFFPVLILFTIRWFQSGFDLSSPVFWFLMTVCSIAGAVVVFPLSFWMARRNLDFWPGKIIDAGVIDPASMEKRLPKLRNAWGALLLGLVALITIFAGSLILLS